MESVNFFQESFPRAMQMAYARKQLTAAASVAVTTPVNRAYMMIPKRKRMSTASGSAFMRSFQPNRGPAAPHSGCSLQIHATVARMATVRMTLGMMFPKNSLPMDWPV
jgi:hypothetical protein